ncbi:MAG: hypothetical protein OXL41_11590 [Nitrospinae bacterium]|nr:hypothetical protein [Nitrospinota bacterium]
MTPRCIVCYGREHVDVLTGFKHDVLGHDVILDNIPATMCIDCGELTYSIDASEEARLRYEKLADPIIATHSRNGINEETYQPRRDQIIIHGYRDWEDMDDYGTITEDGVFHPTPPEIMKKIKALRAKNLTRFGGST